MDEQEKQETPTKVSRPARADQRDDATENELDAFESYSSETLISLFDA
jgi:hypothetical protein